MSSMLNCVIIDDEPLAREGMAKYVQEVDFLTLVDTCEDPVALMRLMDRHPVDLVFLDIQTPKMNGIEYLKIVKDPPMVIITTAFPGYALDGFQLNVLDYLVKPITFDRFLKSANKARDYHRLITRAAAAAPAAEPTITPTATQTLNNAADPTTAPATDYFFIRCGAKYEKIYFSDILYVRGTQNYVTIYTRKGKYLTLLYLKNLEQNLDSASFIRVHKSFIISIDKIEGIEGNEIFIGPHRIPISRNYRDQVIEQVVSNKLWDKIKFS